MKMKTAGVAALLILLTTATPAVAYIDPGSGSAIMSAVIGFFVAIAMAVKTYWYKIKGFFVKKKPDTTNDTVDGEKPDN